MATVYFTAYPDIKWQVQHIDEDYVYLALTEMTELTIFGTDSNYLGSTLAAKCTEFLNNRIPDVAEYLEYVTASGVTNKVFIPEKEWYERTWDWPTADPVNRICKLSGVNTRYWTSSKDSYYNSRILGVSDSGSFPLYYPNESLGFRPAVKVKFK